MGSPSLAGPGEPPGPPVAPSPVGVIVTGPGSDRGSRRPLSLSSSAVPVPMSTSSLYFLAQVGKTSLIMALVGEEFPEEVSGEGTRTPPPRAPSLGGTALSPVSLAGDGGVWEVLAAPGAVTATGLVQVRSVRTTRSSSRGGVFLSLCSDPDLEADPDLRLSLP